MAHLLRLGRRRPRSRKILRPSGGPRVACTKPSRVRASGGAGFLWIGNTCSTACQRHFRGLVPWHARYTDTFTNPAIHPASPPTSPPSAVPHMLLRFARKTVGLAAVVYALTSLTLPPIPHLMVQSKLGGEGRGGGERRAAVHGCRVELQSKA